MVQNNQAQKDGGVSINFFFNAQGNAMENSVLGMYRSLLLQLFMKLLDLKTIFNSSSLTVWTAGRIPDWTVEILKGIFEQAILQLGRAPLVCFIDTLDECNQEEIRDVIAFLERIGKLAASRGFELHVCLSSIHYPHITVKFGVHLVLEGQESHAGDITKYISDKLNIGQSRLAKDIRHELERKSCSIFMWVVLVVGILNREYDDDYVHLLQKRLREIPSDLHKLFRDILIQDDHYRLELRLCMQWILFARTPLNPEQLYCAILSGIDDSFSWCGADRASIDDMKRFILSSSKGLAEVTSSTIPTVQFIHESIKDFLLKSGSMESIWGHIEHPEGKSHEQLKQCCINYARIDLSSYIDLGRPPIRPAGWIPWYLAQTLPLLQYSIQNILYHADKAERFEIFQDGFLESWDLDQWIALHNVWSKSQSSEYAEDTRLLYILAEANTSYLIEKHSDILACLEQGDEPYGCPLVAAMVGKSHDAVRVFRTVLSKSQNLSPSVANMFRESFQQVVEHHDLAKPHKARRVFAAAYKRSTLSYLAEYGDEANFAFFLETEHLETDVKDEGSYMTPLSWAAIKGHEAIAKILLDSGRVDSNVIDHEGRTALWKAIDNGHGGVTNLLLNIGGASPDIKDIRGETQLLYAARTGQSKVVKVLLETGTVK